MLHIPLHKAGTTPSWIKKVSQFFIERLGIRTQPVVKVYQGFASREKAEVFGHVFLWSPRKQEKFTTRFWHNAISLLRLFMVRPLAGVMVRLHCNGRTIEMKTAQDGFFHFDWVPFGLEEGWNDVRVEMAEPHLPATGSTGRLFVPGSSALGIISDIDDTFLISHSSSLRKRLFVLFTRNPRTREPFRDVVKHYQLLAAGRQERHLQRPFFFVSSSEWNLYDYIREFAENYKLPDGVYLLSQVKKLHQLLMTGQGKHNAKFFRISRLLLTYNHMRFILLGDDSQEDPRIYAAIVKDFPGRIAAVYLRHVRKSRQAATKVFGEAIRAQGVDVCYFTDSTDAIMHSKKSGFIS